jgi:hypothetical protein
MYFFTRLFPRCSFVCHHGGAGTTFTGILNEFLSGEYQERILIKKIFIDISIA